MKVINKACDVWPLFILKLNDGIHMGMKLFDPKLEVNCLLCKQAYTYDAFDTLSDVIDKKDFIFIYKEIFDVINQVDVLNDYYEDRWIKKRGIQFEYINELEELAHNMNIDLSYAIMCYKESFEEKYEYPFYIELKDALESLKCIKSSKVNTLEILFEAEKVEYLVDKNEQKYLNEKENYEEENNEKEIFNISNKNPEEVIKLMKERKGIFL